MGQAPIKDVVILESFINEQVTEKLTQVGVIGLIIKMKGMLNEQVTEKLVEVGVIRLVI